MGGSFRFIDMWVEIQTHSVWCPNAIILLALHSHKNTPNPFLKTQPIDYNVHPELKKKLPPEAGTNNFLVRFLSNVHLDELGYKELGIAKQVIRQVTVAGTRDNMAESLLRMGQYFGWVPLGGLGTEESQDSDADIAQSCIRDVIQMSPEERYADHNSPEWQVFYQRNKLDCQLYEVARSTWRAQIQTVIPLALQVDRKCKVQAEKKEKDREILFKEMCRSYFHDEWDTMHKLHILVKLITLARDCQSIF